MIDAKDLRVVNSDGDTIQQCPGCSAICTVKNPPIFPYICNTCWIKGWRSRGKFACSPEDKDTRL